MQLQMSVALRTTSGCTVTAAAAAAAVLQHWTNMMIAQLASSSSSMRKLSESGLTKVFHDSEHVLLAVGKPVQRAPA